MGIWPMGANRKSQKFIFLAKMAEKCRDASILLNINVINILVIIKIFEPGLIKSDSPTSRATDFWGRASEKILLARPRTSVFSGPLQS